jgi:general secretion pathway protein D
MGRLLIIVAGFLLTGGVCLGQQSFAAGQLGTPPSAARQPSELIAQGHPLAPVPANPQEVETPPPNAEASNPSLQDKLQELKSQYGAKDVRNGAGSEVLVQPKQARSNFNLAGDARSIYTQIGNFFGIRVSFDESAPSRYVRFEIQNADFNLAMQVAGLMTHTFWVPVTSHEVLVAADTAAKRRELERMVQKTFYLPDATTPQEINDVVNMLRTLLEIRFVTQQPGTSSITVRASQPTLDTAEVLLKNLSLNRPQVMLQIQVFEVNHSMLRSLGVQLPLQFQIFNINSAVLAALTSGNLQNIIAQLIASGGLNSSNLGSIAAIVAQLQNQQSSLLANPVATFGGGLTLFGVGVPPAVANFSLNESRVTSLEDTTMQASQGNAATLHIGTRYPVLTQSFSSGFSVAGQSLGVSGAVPGFNYEDLGVTVKAKPQINGNEAVTLDMELDIRTLGGQTFNSIPVIQNRTYKGMIRVKNNEPAVIAGMLSKSEQKTLSGVPGIGKLPLFSVLTSNDVRNNSDDELVVIVTPHIVISSPERTPLIAVGQ